MKTYIKIQLISVFALALLIFNACTDDFAEKNTRESLVTEDLIDVNLLFTRVQVYAISEGIPDGLGGGFNTYCGMVTRGDGRPFTVGDSPGAWNSLFGNYARNLADIINICTKRNEANGDNNLDNKIAMARILKAWAYARVTEIYGDIPYSESCLPVEDAVLQPKYDSQKSIYEDIFKELKEAAAQLNASNESYGSADLIYGGDVDKWKKLANSLRLRYALRVRYADENLAKSNMSDLTEANLITSLDDDAFVMTEGNSNWWNGNYDGMINRGGVHTSVHCGKTMIDILIGNGTPLDPIDPRTAVYADTSWAKWPGKPGYEQYSSFGYRGEPLLGGTVVPVEMKYPWGGESTSTWSAFWYAPVIERPLMRSSEVYFALAEAALFGLKTGDADALYKKGIDQALAWTQRLYETSKPQMSEYLGIYYSTAYPNEWDETWEADYFADKEMTQEEIDAFKADAVYTLSGTTEEKHEMIMNQKLVALYPDGNEGWTEWRRTGYPRVLIGTDLSQAGDGPTPRRMPWPQVEQSVNSASYEAALQAFGGSDDRLVRTWFDANTAAPHKHPGTVPLQDAPYVQ